MQKNSTEGKNRKRKAAAEVEQASGEASKSRKRKVEQLGELTIGLDLGDKTSCYCILDEQGAVSLERRVETTKKGLAQAFGRLARCRIGLEVGTHSPWVSRLLKSFGHEVIVANARRVKLITQSNRKNDKLDAKTLARLARIDPDLLRPIQHRSEEAQQDLLRIRVRAALVETRTALINSARGLAKALGERLPKCGADSADVKCLQELPTVLKSSLQPLLEEVASLSNKIQACDEQIEQIARSKYPETQLLKQVGGVGTLIALTFVLTVEDPSRFRKSRDVGCYVGLCPRQRDSGERQPQLGISKEGDGYLRKLLVQGAHCILGRRGADTDLKRWGAKLCARGGKNARKRAVVAVARKLGILLHRLWVTGEVYEPLRHAHGQLPAPAKRKAA
jgi:transposase